MRTETRVCNVSAFIIVNKGASSTAHLHEHEPLIHEASGNASDEEQRNPKPGLDMLDSSSGFEVTVQEAITVRRRPNTHNMSVHRKTHLKRPWIATGAANAETTWGR